MADFLLDNISGGEDVADTLIRLYKSLNVMFSNIDSKNVTSLETKKTKISSGDGLTEIDGAKIIMNDAKGKKRLIMGADDSGNFTFTLMNALGEDSLSLSSDGNAVFSGDIKTKNNAEIGNSVFLGKDDVNAGVKTIQFYDDDTDDRKKVRIEAKKDEKGVAELNIVADRITLTTLNGVYDYGGNYFITSSPGGAYVLIDGVEYPVKFR